MTKERLVNAQTPTRKLSNRHQLLVSLSLAYGPVQHRLMSPRMPLVYTAIYFVRGFSFS